MKKKLLPWIIALSALSVSGSAAFYSVSGLGKMFAGASMEVMLLAGSLEFAKLVTASLLYQYWKKLNIGLKIYLSLATLVLIFITSAGIYGFLSSAYQETSFKVQNQDKNIEILDKNISVVKKEIENYDRQITQKNSRLVQLTTIRTNLQTTQDNLIEKSKSTSAVRQQIKDVDSEIKRMDQEISVLNDSISSKNSKISRIEEEKMGVSSNADIAKEVGPLKYIATLTGSSIDQVVNWYIIVLMLVFDPLAISLVIAANFAFEMNKDEEEIKEKQIKKKKENSMWFKNFLQKIKEFFKRKPKNVQEELIIEDIKPTVEVKSEPKIEELPIVENKIEEEIEEKKEKDPIENIQEKEEDKPKEENKYDDEDPMIFAENQKILRERFRSNPGVLKGKEGRNEFRNNLGGDINPLNLR